VVVETVGTYKETVAKGVEMVRDCCIERRPTKEEYGMHKEAIERLIGAAS